MKISAKNVFYDPASQADEKTVCHLLSMAFGFSNERAREYVSHAGVQSFRMVRDAAGSALACAALLNTSHAFGGADIPAANIAHVAITPEARGRGLARPLVDALCEDARSQGALMVSLFASARPVYRKSGFELAGSEILYEADTAAMPARTSVDFFPIALTDDRIVKAYSDKKNNEAGLLDRAAVHWKELTRTPTDALAAYGVGHMRDGPLLAYVLVDASDSETLHVRDWYASNGGMAEALLCFIGRFRSVYPKACWHGGPQDDLIAAMPDKGWRLVHQEEWLARILEPQKALERRGYLLRDALLGMHIEDPDGENLEIGLSLSAGKMTVSDEVPGRTPSITIERPFFASLFTGFSSASQLARRGRLSGSPEAVSLCDLVFSGPQPWVAEHF
ncbi:GNAT family N-acetyltransferase [Mesorhizobium sp. 1M-11]|uniref:GNAT family N-acetyltransferase n=1 Tax=Mesorhizobium sp. 1M-11 TaxID=1529006 RepID=UPI0009E8FD63|nr:GNAT family N-acetyltransferase [Mesorhizobium sp. 1M-11]